MRTAAAIASSQAPALTPLPPEPFRVPPSSRASHTPAAPPAGAVITESGTTSAAVSRMSCQRAAPRAVSSAVSLSRCAASSRATATSAASASTISCSALIASSDRATARLLPVFASTVGSCVVSCTELRAAAFDTEDTSAPTLAEIVDRSVLLKRDMSGWATQVPVAALSWPGAVAVAASWLENAVGATTSGP
jgi:hypothetical protein